MKAVGTILLSVALLLAAASAQECTQETCGEGPVWAYFSSSDCSGTPTFNKPDVYDAPCPTPRTSFIGEDRLTTTYYENDDCNESIGFWSETYFFGVCSLDNSIKRGDEQMMTNSQRRHASMKRGTEETLASGSRILLANVNDTLPAPQSGFQYDSSVILASDNWEDCYSADNCTLADGSPALYYMNYFDSPNCTDLSSSQMMPKFQPGQCYNYHNTSYVQVSCTGEHSYQYVYYTNSSCSGTAYFSEQAYVVCGEYTSILGLCSGPLEPIYGSPEIIPTGNEPSEPTSGAPVEEIIPSNDPPTPTGNASSLHAPIMTIFAAILAIFAF